MLLLTVLVSSACSSQTKDNSINLTFSEYYQTANDYEIIYPLLNKYFSCIQNAYDTSNKSDLNSFVLSDDYQNISNQLSEISNDDSGLVVNGNTNLLKEYLARLQLLKPYLDVEELLAEKSLLSSPNKEWFNKLDILLTATYSEYQNGTGEQQSTE